MFINGLSSNLLGSINKQLSVTKITGIGALVNIAINLAIIPVLSFIGASISTVFTEYLIMILFTYIISRTNYSVGRTIFNELWRIIVPNIVMLLVLVYVQLPLILMIILCGVVYMAGIFLTKAIDEQDINILKNMVGIDTQ
jgi:O-antigen/teichoic acid export membrane protein